MDSLGIGMLKYIELRRILLNEGFKLQGYNRGNSSANICLVSDIHLVKTDYPFGVGISYRLLIANTIDRFLSHTNYVNYPVKVRISDGLDGSGCHRLYQQVMLHSDLTTKNTLLFGFKVIHINSADGISIWKNLIPNSPFSFRPIAILALPENQNSVQYLMNSLVNEETALIEANGLKLSKGHANAN